MYIYIYYNSIVHISIIWSLFFFFSVLFFLFFVSELCLKSKVFSQSIHGAYRVPQEWNSLHCIWSRYLAGKALSNHGTVRRGWFMAESLNWVLVFHRKIYYLDQSGARTFVWSIFWMCYIFSCSFIKTILSHTTIVKVFYRLILRTLKDIDPILIWRVHAYKTFGPFPFVVECISELPISLSLVTWFPSCFLTKGEW